MTEFGNGNHLQLIDGSGYVFRSFFMAERSLPARNRYRSDGVPVGAVHFFCNMLFKAVQDRQRNDPSTHAAVIFDHSGKTFRNDIYPEYKANRPPPPPDLVPQFPLTRDATRAFNFACLELENYEADDIIATLATRARDAGGEVTIISSDKDLMQLVGDGIEMHEPMKNVRIGGDQVREKFGVGPERVIDVQALAGDSTDNVPGAPGIGVKTAAQLIEEYGDLDTLLARAGEIRQPKRRQTLIDHADRVRMSRRLVTLLREAPVDLDLDSLAVREPDTEELFEFLLKQEFRTIVRRVAEHYSMPVPEFRRLEPADQQATAGKISESGETAAAELPFNAEAYECVNTVEALEKWISRVYRRGYVAVDTETDRLDEMQANLVGISLAVEPGEACYIPLGHVSAAEPSLEHPDIRHPDQLEMQVVLDRLGPLLEDPSIKKIGQNIKFDFKILARLGIRMAPVEDTLLMSYAMHSGLHRFSMDELSEKYLNHNPIPIKELIGTGKSAITFGEVELSEAVKYAGEDADITLRLWKTFSPMLHRMRGTTVYQTLERPLIPVLADMEMTGIRVDRSQLELLSSEFAGRIDELKGEIHEAAGEEFNVASPKQLGVILFDKLKLPGGQKVKTGGWATGARILEELVVEGHTLPSLVLDWRQMAKLKSTYTDALQDRINPETGRVHTSYVISGANTGRLASTDPNLQNIPIRTEEGRRIREAFVAKEGHVLLSLDYSQIELRILAHIAGIDALKTAFADGMDIHAMTASEIFGVPLEEMDPITRRRAKAINFGVIYGISSFGLARDLKISRSEAKEFIDTYFERFPGIRNYMERTKASAREKGYVTTLFGRKIHTPGINDKGPGRGFAERGAINAPIQGTAADIIRRAMIRIPDAIGGMPARMLIQVHDELLFEVREDAVEDLAKAAVAVMERADRPAARISPTLVVDAGWAANWAQAH